MTGMEPWAISAVSGVAAMIFQNGGQALGVLGKTLDEKTKKLIFAASNQLFLLSSNVTGIFNGTIY
ncbi:MAG: hypothetical protein V7K25_09985 [Nostoc sp.]|uniref:hypothetical protein n=1 Tax=Nostoc sp. TaxID=1180 RepID=UPI002FFA70F2